MVLSHDSGSSQDKESSKNATPESSSSCIYLPETRYPANRSRGCTSEENGEYSKPIKVNLAFIIVNINFFLHKCTKYVVLNKETTHGWNAKFSHNFRYVIECLM